MTSSNGIVKGQSIGYLANCVGISISLGLTISFTLAIETTIDTITSIANTSDDTRVVSMTRSNGIVKGQSIGYLADCVGISISLGLTVSHGSSGQNNKDKGSHLAG